MNKTKQGCLVVEKLRAPSGFLNVNLPLRRHAKRCRAARSGRPAPYRAAPGSQARPRALCLSGNDHRQLNCSHWRPLPATTQHDPRAGHGMVRGECKEQLQAQLLGHVHAVHKQLWPAQAFVRPPGSRSRAALRRAARCLHRTCFSSAVPRDLPVNRAEAGPWPTAAVGSHCVSGPASGSGGGPPACGQPLRDCMCDGPHSWLLGSIMWASLQILQAPA